MRISQNTANGKKLKRRKRRRRGKRKKNDPLLSITRLNTSKIGELRKNMADIRKRGVRKGKGGTIRKKDLPRKLFVKLQKSTQRLVYKN